MKIKVLLEENCRSCNAFYKTLDRAVQEIGNADVELQKTTDLSEILRYGALSFPAVFVDEKRVLMDKKANVNELKQIIEARRHCGLDPQSS